MSIASSYPSIRPSLLLDFANTKKLDPRIAFTRTTTARYYDGKTVAKAEENLLLYSQEFNDAAWAKTASTVTANSDTAPDGTTTADKIIETTTNSTHLLQQSRTLGAGVYTMSVFAKLGTGSRFLTIGFNRALDAYVSATFDLSLGTNTQTLISSYTGASATITTAAQGFYRCTLTATVDSISAVRVGLASTGTHADGNRGFESYIGNDTASLLVWGAQLEQRSAVTAYTPTTTQPITNYVPVLLTAPAGVARFDHNPVTEESLGLLIEEQRSNLFQRSEELNNAYWDKLNVTVSANQLVAPDGTLTADFVAENTSTGSHLVYKLVGISNSTVYTVSVYAKAASRNILLLNLGDNFTANAFVFVNLTTGAVASSGAGILSTTVTPVGNGWYRVSATSTSTGTSGGLYFGPSQSTGLSYTGDGRSGIYIWGAQLEAGAFPTSYIPTVASTVTRNADVASMTGNNFSSWYNATEGTVYAEAVYINQIIGSASATNIIRIDDGTSNNVVDIRTVRDPASPQADVTVNANGSNQLDSVGFQPIIAGTIYKRTFAYAFNNTIPCNNGVLDGAVDTIFVTPTNTRVIFGIGVSQAFYIRKFSYYPERLPNNQLQALTSL